MYAQSHVNLHSRCKDAKRILDEPESITTGKLQLRHELSHVLQKDMSVVDYTARIKEICDSLASINVTIKEDEMV